jgi:hypothetical protein
VTEEVAYPVSDVDEDSDISEQEEIHQDKTENDDYEWQ